MKRTKSGEETGTRHSKAAQTQHWTQDCDYSPGDPDADTRTVRARLQSHAGGAVICFSGRFKLQLTADLFIPASLNTSIIGRKKKKKWLSDEMLGATWTSSSYCFSWYIAVSHPDHRPSLSRKKRGNMGAGGFGWGRLDGNFDRWRWVMDKAVKSAVLPWLSLSCKVLPKLR